MPQCSSTHGTLHTLDKRSGTWHHDGSVCCDRAIQVLRLRRSVTSVTNVFNVEGNPESQLRTEVTGGDGESDAAKVEYHVNMCVYCMSGSSSVGFVCVCVCVFSERCFSE